MTSTSKAATTSIGDRPIGNGEACYVIAEIGNNHNGDFDRAIALVDASVAAGADCAKFQMRKLDEVYRASSLSGKDDDLAVEYTLDLLRRFELTTEQQRKLAAYCASKGILYLCTPWDAASVAVLEGFGVHGLQGRLRRPDQPAPARRSSAATKKTLIVSTGMSTTAEIKAAVAVPRTSATRPMCCCIARAPIRRRCTTSSLRFMETLRDIHPARRLFRS